MVCRMWARGSSAHIPTASSASAKGGPASSRKGTRRGAYIMLRRPCTHMPIYIYIYVYILYPFISIDFDMPDGAASPPTDGFFILSYRFDAARAEISVNGNSSIYIHLYSFIPSSIHLLHHLFIQSFMHSLIHSFICVIHIIADCGRLVSDRSVYLSVYLSVCL